MWACYCPSHGHINLPTSQSLDFDLLRINFFVEDPDLFATFEGQNILNTQVNHQPILPNTKYKIGDNTIVTFKSGTNLHIFKLDFNFNFPEAGGLPLNLGEDELSEDDELDDDDEFDNENHNNNLLLDYFQTAFLSNQNTPHTKKQENEIIDLENEDTFSNNSHNPAVVKETSFEEDLNSLIQLFPECKEEYIRDQLRLNNHPGRVETVANILLENNYPKKEAPKQPVAVQKKEEPINYENHAKYISSPLYQDNATNFLASFFNLFPMHIIKQTLRKYNYHLYPSFKNLMQLKEQYIDKKVQCPFKLLVNRRKPNVLKHLDSTFENERDFVEEEFKVEFVKHKIESTGEQLPLFECPCCFEELEFKDMTECNNGHIFCKICAKKSVKATLEGGKSKITCLEPTCEATFSLSEIKNFLDEKTFKFYEKKAQFDELKQLGDPNLCYCPFCDFAMIIENPEERVFTCINNECLKESCRLCKLESHIPLSCEEYKTQKSLNLQNTVAEKMTEALLCHCPVCSLPLVKQDGCNKIKCPCGQTICFICKKAIAGYNHFGVPPLCPLQADTDFINAKNVNNAKRQAITQLLQEHPSLKVNLDKELPDLPEIQTNKPIPNPAPQADANILRQQALELNRIQREAHIRRRGGAPPVNVIFRPPPAQRIHQQVQRARPQRGNNRINHVIANDVHLPRMDQANPFNPNPRFDQVNRALMHLAELLGDTPAPLADANRRNFRGRGF